ncbi:N-acetylglucosamine kinase-like protein [Janibacter sp. HTCC2649]|uniref:N-acetylglucosamine kinase n=1 Tax=Janibacter sp. HTCC2649 TaxID=313589 RepID=UPI0000670B25|nr:BadF/BadG/BcrA/BcrD ATPase family protein [Janibacter sp. HTCC2649]EAP99697.1 N-acetylglucosamine kinase-like protein [Janibacter sp. HTCC2649]
MILVAVDAGGTRTRASIVQNSFESTGVGLAGRGNPVSGGADAAFAEIAAAIGRAAAAAGVSLAEVDAVTLASAGGAAFEEGFLAQALAGIGITAPCARKGDLAALFASGTHETSGYSLVAGTGATAVRIVGNVEVQTIDGLGWLLGDTGSGFWIGHQVARAVASALDGRTSTSMVGPALEVLGIEPDLALRASRPVASHELIRVVYTQSPFVLAALAPVAFLDDHDEVSSGIVEAAAHGLAQAVIDVHSDDVQGPLVLGGGVMAGQPRLRERTMAALTAAGLSLPVIDAADGLVGASVLGLRDAGVTVDAAAFETVRSATAAQLVRATAR